MLESVALSLGYSMADICHIIPDILEDLERKKPLSYQAFVNRIDKDLNNIISDTESGKQHHFIKSEDALTEHIIAQLKRIYPSVHHDAQQGGHCDIYIEVKSSSGIMYKWIMEAKIWNGFSYVYDGLVKQLLGSYATGGENNCCGGMIFYSKKQEGSKVYMDKWCEGLIEHGIHIKSRTADGLRASTSHKLNSGSGADFFVNHYCIDVYHAPTEAKLRAKS